MGHTVTITSQGQVSIPAKIRRELGFVNSQKAIVSVEDGKVIFEPVADFLSFRGSIKSKKKPLTNEQLHEKVAQAVADEWENENR